MSSIVAAVMPGPGKPIEVRELPVPDLARGEALLDVEFSEVCGTDVHLRDGRLQGVPYPIVPGHVSIGRLSRIRGPLMDIEGQPLSEGDRVTFLDVHRTCHACWYCLVAKAATRCPHRRVYGITYGVEHGPTGGWATQLHLMAGTHCIRADNVDPLRFMAGGCGLPTALHAIERADIRIGDTVVVLGSGPVGLSAVIFARMAGALRVLCIGAPAHRLACASNVGADAVLDFTAHDHDHRIAWVHQHSGGRGADVTIEATGSPAAVAQALDYTRDAGRVVVVGQYTDHGTVEINPHVQLNRKHLDVRGCWGSDFSHFDRVTRIMADPQRSAPWSHITLQHFGLSEVNGALDRVGSGELIKAIVDPSRS
jgi:L-iditol 2-dehydrogenase